MKALLVEIFIEIRTGNCLLPMGGYGMKLILIIPADKETARELFIQMTD